jgi:hypothetical protein
MSAILNSQNSNTTEIYEQLKFKAEGSLKFHEILVAIWEISTIFEYGIEND